ncbi:MAG: DUF642 domain-containing protein, partial [Verrucomicrobiota bacterium]
VAGFGLSHAAPIAVSSYTYGDHPANGNAINSNWGDAGNVKLTDGVIPAATNYDNMGHAGFWYTPPSPQITFDLGSVQSLGAVNLSYWSDSIAIFGPRNSLGDSLLISVSDDNVTYSAAVSYSPFTGPLMKEVTTSMDVTGKSGRYVRLAFQNRADLPWMWLSEVSFDSTFVKQPTPIDLAGATGVFLADTAAGGDGTLAGSPFAPPYANKYASTTDYPWSDLTDGVTSTKWIGAGTDGWGDYPGTAGKGAGFYFTLPTATNMQNIQFFTEDSASNRSPATMTIEGSTATGSDLMTGSNWTLLYSGTAGLAAASNNSAGAKVNFTNATAYSSYRVLFPTTLGASPGGVQIAGLVATDAPYYSSACDLLTFGAGSVITPTSSTTGTVALSVPYGTDLATLAPAYTISPAATCVPGIGVSPDFSLSNPATYTITAEDGITTKTYSVAVTVAPVHPVNDNFADAIALTGNNGNLAGHNNFDATFEGGEPQCGFVGTTNTVWFKWECSQSGHFIISTAGSRNTANNEWDAVLGVYTGSSLATLAALPGTPQDTFLEETVTVSVVAGTTYYIQLGGYPNSPPDVAANIALTWSLAPLSTACDILTFGTDGVITGNDIAFTVPFGTVLATLAPSYTVSSAATGVGPTPNFAIANPVSYTITAEDGITTKTYSVKVTVAPFSPELIVNGSFETGTRPSNGSHENLSASDVTGWTVDGSGGVVWYMTSSNWGGGGPTGGGSMLVNVNGNMTIYQSFAVNAGSEYTVSYYEQKRGGGGYMDTTVNVASGMVIGANGSPVAVDAGPAASIVQTTAVNAAWTLHSFTFTPDTTTTATITIGNHYGGGQGDNDGTYVDLVKVTAPVATSNPYDTWGNGTFANSFTDKDSSLDPDGDGMTNFQEFAFGLDPTSASSVNPVTLLIGDQFTYTRYAASNLTYTVECSTDLAGWAPAITTELIGEANASGVQIVTVTVSDKPANGKLFVRVRAE